MGNFDPKSHIGEVHGVFTLVEVLKNKDKYRHYVYKGICNECGYERFAHYGEFSGPKSMTKNCTHKDATGRYIKNTDWKNKRIGAIFSGMKARCYNRNNNSYKWYGAKGIKVYEEWLSSPHLFEEWALINGYADDLTIDRIDENQDYCPDNCRWISIGENAKYKSTTRVIEVDGIAHSGKDWAKECALGCNTINMLSRKHSEEEIKEFIRRRMADKTKTRKSHQTWFNVYGLE